MRTTVSLIVEVPLYRNYIYFSIVSKLHLFYQFEDILKPTFNRVDILEVEILDDQNEPRLFGEEVVRVSIISYLKD